MGMGRGMGIGVGRPWDVGHLDFTHAARTDRLIGTDLKPLILLDTCNNVGML